MKSNGVMASRDTDYRSQGVLSIHLGKLVITQQFSTVSEFHAGKNKKYPILFIFMKNYMTHYMTHSGYWSSGILDKGSMLTSTVWFIGLFAYLGIVASCIPFFKYKLFIPSRTMHMADVSILVSCFGLWISPIYWKIWYIIFELYHSSGIFLF